jgi:hypothetical protein
MPPDPQSCVSPFPNVIWTKLRLEYINLSALDRVRACNEDVLTYGYVFIDS